MNKASTANPTLFPTNSLEIFRDHGFVQRTPQYWAIPRGKTEIEVERDDKVETTTILHGDFEFTVKDNGEGGIAVELWDLTEDWMFAAAEAQFRRQIRRLNRMKNIDWDLGWEHYDIPRNEWDAIWAFHQAYVKALTHALIALDDDDPASDESLGRFEHHYDDFETEVDTINYNEPNCESSELIDFQSYEAFDEHKTNYQTMIWSRRAEDEDVCLHLDDVLQICSSYRPHYHEFFVHFPARYIETVKRVIFLGSGDAMLLHEILKYPSLELVVGLEIDQQVTRTSSKYFQTQPHYDDERVQWWYGDATKTLPLLPREYWGSFDLVLVDLSETVVSLTVTGQHDILDVISMLLKPEGILLENELYIEKLSNHFDHTIQIFYGSPKVCTQVLTMSSNKVDFLRSPTFDHSLENYLVKPLENSQDRFKYIHDFEMTSAKEQGKCHDSDGDCNVTTEQGRKAGIMYLLEAEDTSIPLSSESLEERMYSVLRNDGFKPVSTPSKDDDVVVIVMKEGYVVARVWPELGYCGFDINLWGGFDKSNKVYSTLAKTVGSTSLSSYRIVVGGMHGSSTWEKDLEVIGVQVSQKRDCEEDDLSDRDEVDQEAYGIALFETIDLAGSEGLVVAVVCGVESEAECPSLQVAKSHPSVEKVVTLWACADDSEDVDTNTRYAAKMYECEKHTMNHIEATVISKHMKLDMIVFDSSTTLSMTQVLSSILSVPSNGKNWLEEQYAFLAPSHGKDGRKQQFMNRYRTQRHSAPISHATLTMEGRDTFLGLGILWGGDDNAVEKLIALEYQIRQRLPKIGIDLRRITGGKEHAKYDLRHEQESFSRDDYGLQPVQEHRSQQRALGRQTIFQLELGDTTAMPSLDDLADFMAKALEELKYSPSRFEEYSDVGDGGLVVAIFKEGSAILTWDGKDHVDINMFAFDQSKKVADALLNAFVRLSQGRLELALRDDQPRGVGGVVNFSGETDKVMKTPDKNVQKNVLGHGFEVRTSTGRPYVAR
jgi:spermidine synthase